MAVSILSNTGPSTGPSFAGGAAGTALFSGRPGLDQRLDERLGQREFVPTGLRESKVYCAPQLAVPVRARDLSETVPEAEPASAPTEPDFAPPLRRAAPRGRRFEHGRPASPARPRSSRPSNRPADRPTALVPTRRAIPATIAEPQSSRRGLRLTRRGQVALLLIVAGAVYAAFGLGRASAVPQAGGRSGVHVVVVRQGDSLWAIAARVAPNQDPRDVVGKLKSLNHLKGSVVQAGQSLLLP